MQENDGSVVDAEKNVDAEHAPEKPARKKWLRVLLYVLAALGALFIAITIYAVSKQPPKVERPTIDEAAMIDNVMTDNYGKYSEAKRGWLYVADDNRTYLMRVVQQVKLPDNPEGDEMYFLASGAAIDGEPATKLGVFHIRPDPDDPGTLVSVSQPSMYGGSSAVRPEDVHFEALSEQLWGWVVKVKEGSNPNEGLVAVNNVMLTSHANEIVRLAEFPAAREYDLDCQRSRDAKTPAAPAQVKEEASGTADAAQPGVEGETAAAATEEEAEEVVEDEPEEFILCQKRRWTYRMGTVSGSIPVPITVTASGTLDGQSVPEKKWKLMFDSKAFRYNVPDDLSE